MRPHSPSGERGHESESRCGPFSLLNGGGFHQRLEVLVDHSLLGVGGLRNAVQKHCHSGDVLASPSKLGGVVPLVHDVALDLAGMTPSTTRRVMHMGCNVLHQACWLKRWLVLPPLL